MGKTNKEQHETSPLFGVNAAYIEERFERYLEDPNSLDAKWRDYFKGFTNGADVSHEAVREEFLLKAKVRGKGGTTLQEPEVLRKQAAVQSLIERYRLIGHRQARLDPLGLQQREPLPDLKPQHYGLSDADMSSVFNTGNLAGLGPTATLGAIHEMLQTVYSSAVGAEFMHVSNTAERRWLQEKFESSGMHARLNEAEKLDLLDHLTAAEGLERYLHTRYVGQKRFSLEGGESLIPMLNELIQKGGGFGLQAIVIGMAHRGRINVLVNCVGKAPKDLFSEFEGRFDAVGSSGDVKYHMGFSTDVTTPGGNVHIALAFNPSHLEIVNPVVEGSVRARLERRDDEKGDSVMPILVHGDSAFSGQGVVMETLQMSQVTSFYTGGTVHIVCNNQVGFTTSDPKDLRSTEYCTDVAKMIEAPVFHVNGDDPHAVILVTRLALEYRMRFNKDVVIDLVCYRRHGHNEADEPAATQPFMYKEIRSHKTTRQLYADRLVTDGTVKEGEPQQMLDAFREALDAGDSVSKDALGEIGHEHMVNWHEFDTVNWDQEVQTGVEKERLAALGERLVHLPDTLKLHPRVARIYQDRQRMASGETVMDWGFAETLAYATLLTDGVKIRLTGQDSGRGTFFHRHAVLHDQVQKLEHVPLQHLADDQGDFRVTDSFLSEEAVLGFEYGYATAEPSALVIWEAQFGDFANGAQVVIDQFISSGETKWGRYCGLVMYLPHGYEGQGPEHSSARLERYLQLCAEKNMQVCVPSTPAQMFHMVRRQMLWDFRKPLIVMTPKSLLRHKLATSSLEELAEGGFNTVIDEIDDLAASQVDRIVFCSGKVYYDLLEARRGASLENVAIVRIEQLYPFPKEKYTAAIQHYPNAKQIVWCQEEHMNQGAWYQIRYRLQDSLEDHHVLSYAGRDHAASPAVGYYQVHVEQQHALVSAALGLTSN
ncbi:MAG: 2-oxoglutarate dehydrogenase E1 component [Pseudomonadota bacterium]